MEGRTVVHRNRANLWPWRQVRNHHGASRSGKGGEANGAQRFGDAPGLGEAAARRERRLGVEDLADRADAGFAQLLLQAVEQAARAGAGRRERRSARRRRTGRPASPRPSPDGRRRRARADRRRSAACSRDVRAPASAGRTASPACRAPRCSTAAQRAGSSTGCGSEMRQQLVGPEAGVVAARRLRRRRRRNRYPPSAYQKRRLKAACTRVGAPRDRVARRSVGPRRPPAASASRSQPCEQAERVVEERVDLDRLPPARRHHPVADLGVHPGELVARRRPGAAGRRRDRRRCRSACRRCACATISTSFGSSNRRVSTSPVWLLVAIQRVEEPQRRVGGVIEALVLALRETGWGSGRRGRGARTCAGCRAPPRGGRSPASAPRG